MSYLVIAKCDNTALLQSTLGYFKDNHVEGLTERIKENEETGNLLFDMFKKVIYSEDGTKSVGLLEVFNHHFEGQKDEEGNIIKPDLFSVINAQGEVLKVLASGIKYQENVFDKLDSEGIASIREVIDEYTTIKDENGDDKIVEQSYIFAGLQ